MNIPDHCTWHGARNARQRPERCQQPAKFRCPDGEVRTLLVFHPNTQSFVGPCHWRDAGYIAEQARANWPDFPKGYAPYELSDDEVKKRQVLERRFRHALTEPEPVKSGGLMRQG